MNYTYFDAVLDENMVPVFNGTTDETVDWLVSHEHEDAVRNNDYEVIHGETMRTFSPEAYLARYRTSEI